MEKIKFKDRISKYPNRKKLKIISQNENEILADVVPADDPQVDGTELNAKILNKWQDVISTSEGNAMLAKNKVHIAEENAKLAVKYSKEAIAKAEQAEMVADYVSKSVNNTFIPIKTSELYNDNQFISAKPQTLTNEEKSQARENIGAGTSNFSGDYEDLINKPYIPSYDNVPTKDYIDEKISNLVNSAPETLDTLGEIASALQENDSLITALNSAITNKVDKVAGKGLSTNDFTTNEKQKLNNIEEGAEKNVQSDWSETDTNSDKFIKNKPTIPTKLSDLSQDVDYLTTETDPTVPSWAKQSSKPTYNYSEIQNTPSNLPNPSNLTVKNGTTTLATYNGSNTVEIDLSLKADVGDIPTATSDLTNDSGFITEDDLQGVNDSNWELTLSQIMTTSAVSVVKFTNVFDFYNYDYKIEYETCTEGDFPSTAIIFKFINSSGNDITFSSSTWCRYNINTNYTHSGGTQEGSISPIEGYGLSKLNQTIVDWGINVNDGSGPVSYSGKFIPIYDCYGNRNIYFVSKHIRHSFWCQEYYCYSGTAELGSGNLTQVNGFSLTENNGVNFKVGTNYIKIYRRPGGWNKYSGG